MKNQHTSTVSKSTKPCSGLKTKEKEHADCTDSNSQADTIAVCRESDSDWDSDPNIELGDAAENEVTDIILQEKDDILVGRTIRKPTMPNRVCTPKRMVSSPDENNNQDPEPENKRLRQVTDEIPHESERTDHKG